MLFEERAYEHTALGTAKRLKFSANLENNRCKNMNDLYIQKIKLDWSKIPQDSFLRDIPAFSGIKELVLESPVTFFAGENGSGKSTLLEAVAIAYGFNPEGGTKNYSFSTYDSHSQLYEAVTLAKGYRKAKWGYFLRAESFYNVATKEEEYADDFGCSAEFHKQSHGESFLSLAQNNFQENSVYILDEPEAALSPQRQLTLMAEIHRFAQSGSQFILASHSPILLGLPDADILCFDDTGIHNIQYEDTDSYQITNLFLNDRERLLKQLL